MVSILITAFKEQKTIGKAVEVFLNPETNNFRDFELLIICPDEETWRAALRQAQGKPTKNNINIQRVKDPGKGKPVALNMAFKQAKGEILLLTDGDTFVGDNVIEKMLHHFNDEKVGGVTGRPVAMNVNEGMLGYYGKLLADAAHHKRMVTMVPEATGKSMKFVSKQPGFFVLSGYISMIRNIGLAVPEDVLSDDAYLSYILHEKGYKIEYEPEAMVYIKYPTTLNDWYKQKLRSLGGYVQLWKYGVVKPETRTRSFFQEIQYFWFPIVYAFRQGNINEKIKHLIWSLLLYPIRLWLWIKIWYERKILNKSFEKTWVRIESTK